MSNYQDDHVENMESKQGRRKGGMMARAHLCSCLGCRANFDILQTAESISRRFCCIILLLKRKWEDNGHYKMRKMARPHTRSKVDMAIEWRCARADGAD